MWRLKLRITSYNVCYTKLLRGRLYCLVFCCAGNAFRYRSDGLTGLGVYAGSENGRLVITSYSIHYTKLYDFSSLLMCYSSFMNVTERYVPADPARRI